MTPIPNPHSDLGHITRPAHGRRGLFFAWQLVGPVAGIGGLVAIDRREIFHGASMAFLLPLFKRRCWLVVYTGFSVLWGAGCTSLTGRLAVAEPRRSG